MRVAILTLHHGLRIGSLLFREQPFIEGPVKGPYPVVLFVSLLFREQPFIEGELGEAWWNNLDEESLLFREQPFIEGRTFRVPAISDQVAALSGAAFH